MSNHQQGRCEWNLPRSVRPVHATLWWLQLPIIMLLTVESVTLAPPWAPPTVPSERVHIWWSTRLHGHQPVENHADIMEAFFFFFFSFLQHVCNSPAVPQTETFSLIYHQSVTLSAKRLWLFQAGNKMRRRKKKNNNNNNVWLRRRSDMHNLILWSESLYTKTGKSSQEKWVWFVMWPVIDIQTGLTGADETNFLSFLCFLCFVEVRYSVSKQLRLQLHWDVQKV